MSSGGCRGDDARIAIGVCFLLLFFESVALTCLALLEASLEMIPPTVQRCKKKHAVYVLILT
jgi:hypothetical protein